MDDFYKRYVSLCAEKQKSLSAVAEEIGLSRTSPNGWKKGKHPSDVNLHKLSSYFGVSVEYLIGKEQKEEPTLNESEPGRDYVVVHRNGKTVKYHMSAEQIKAIEPLLKQLKVEDNPDL